MKRRAKYRAENIKRGKHRWRNAAAKA